MRRIEQGAVYSCATRTRTQMDALIADLTKGSAALIFDAQRKAVTFEARTANVRAVSEPTIEKSVSGAKDAFVETLRINTSLVRRRLHTPALKLRQTVVGRQSETTVAVVYLDGIADPARVQRILDRLDTIDEQALLGRGDLEPYLTRRPRRCCRSSARRNARTSLPGRCSTAAWGCWWTGCRWATCCRRRSGC